MRRIDITGQYKKDLRLARKRNLPEEKLSNLLTMNHCLKQTRTMHCMEIMKGQGSVIFHQIGF